MTEGYAVVVYCENGCMDGALESEMGYEVWQSVGVDVGSNGFVGFGLVAGFVWTMDGAEGE
ncbi:hypothetical protein GCM10011507_21100 [Edaphobacter acidisoli]|uniref:Uncharacterized protein n=1 Tax=Edaphobacter acidisoli TaxID=2040573 RepID=A0A916RTZ4_9BACT|nr:hypothetical protein GCM10011507_21100 [Edaphobacter acidisoli]